MKFAYQCYEIPASPLDQSVELFRPEIPLRLIGETGEIRVFGLLDTGADAVVIGRELAQCIGVQIDELVSWEVRGFGDRAHAAFLGHVDVELISGSQSACWRMPVSVVGFGDESDEEMVLLGQTGFLQYFDVRFLGHEHLIELRANSAMPLNVR